MKTKKFKAFQTSAAVLETYKLKDKNC